jgi:hypothetical protein
MTNTDIIRIAFAALESNDPHSAEEYFADDFTWKGTFPKPLNKSKFMGMATALKRAMPDYTLNVRIERELDKERFLGTIDPLGTHTGLFVLPGITPIQPTGNCVALPRHPIEILMSKGKITEISVEDVSQGGMAGLLSFLGIDISEEQPEGYF